MKLVLPADGQGGAAADFPPLGLRHHMSFLVFLLFRYNFGSLLLYYLPTNYLSIDLLTFFFDC
jgi:hypothetical protein